MQPDYASWNAASVGSITDISENDDVPIDTNWGPQCYHGSATPFVQHLAEPSLETDEPMLFSEKLGTHGAVSRRSKRVPVRLVSGTALWFALIQLPAQADSESPWSLSVGYSAVGTDNARLAPSNEREDLIHEPFVNLGYVHEGAVAQYQGRYRWLGRFHHRDSLGDDDVLEGTSKLDVSLSPGRLAWQSAHVRSENLVDRRNLDRPDNRRVSDTVRTGLEYRLGGDSANRLTASLASEWFTSNRGFDDSHRYIAALDLGRSISQVQRVGVRLSGQRVDYDELLVPDYDLWSAQVYTSRQSRTVGISLSGGYSETDRSGLPSEGGLVATGELTWSPVGGHSLGVNASRAFRDRTRVTETAFLDNRIDRDQGSEGGEVFTDTHLGISYNFSGARWGFSGSFAVTEEDFSELPRDSRRYSAYVGVDYQVSPRTSVGMGARGTRTRFKDESRTDEYAGVNVLLRHALGQRTDLSLALDHNDRSSDLSDRSYTENRITLRVTYGLL